MTDDVVLAAIQDEIDRLPPALLSASGDVLDLTEDSD